MSHKITRPTETLDDATQRIEDRIAGRKMAEELFGLIDGNTASRPYMESLIEHLQLCAGMVKSGPEDVEPKHEPIARLGAHVLDYTEFIGRCLDDVPLHRLDWYLRKAEENVKIIGAYMKHPELKSRRWAEMGEPV